MYKNRSIDSVDALKISIQCAMDLKEYYDKASALVKDDDAIAILKGFSIKEEKLRSNLIKVYSKISGKKILYLNLGKKHKLYTLQECGDDANESIRVAKTNETELEKFFVTVSRRLLESELRAVFRELALERQQHLAILESSFEEPLALDRDSIEEESIVSELA